MRITAMLTGAIFVLGASFGTATAAEQFSALDGVSTQPMNDAEMDATQGARFVSLSRMPGDQYTRFVLRINELELDVVSIHKGIEGPGLEILNAP